MMLKKTENDNQDLQRQLTEKEEREQRYEEELKYFKDSAKSLKIQLKKIEQEKEEYALTLLTTEESLVNSQSSQVKIEDELNEKVRDL